MGNGGVAAATNERPNGSGQAAQRSLEARQIETVRGDGERLESIDHGHRKT